jgi:hypothetical protein
MTVICRFQSSLVRSGYFEVLSVQSEKKAPVVEPGDILREFQGLDMRVDSQRLKKLFKDESSASVILVFEKKRWGGTLMRLSFKVLTSTLRIETVPDWVDDQPPPRMVSTIAQELLNHFAAPTYTGGLADTSCFSDMEWMSAILKFSNIVHLKPLQEASAFRDQMRLYSCVFDVMSRLVWLCARQWRFYFCIKTKFQQ